MVFPDIKVKAESALQIYRSGGIWTLLQRIAGYCWKETVSLYSRKRARGGLIVKEICGNRMYLSPHDMGIGKELTAYGIHEPVTTELWRKEIKPGMRVVDLGANIGYYALQAAELVGETGEVIAIEPVPENVRLLKRNIEENHYNNVQIHQLAVGAGDGTTRLYLSRESNWCSVFPRSVHDGYIDVPMSKLDSLLESTDRIDYIKMDLEGYETEAIKGMRRILLNLRPSIFVEIHPPITGGKPMVQLLKELALMGYDTKYVVDKAFNYPTATRKNAVETLNIAELVADNRVSKAQAVLTLFLQSVRPPIS